MRILLASTRGAGHIGPLVPFALACKRAGQEVLLAAPHSAWEHVARAGVPFAGFDDPPAEELDPIWARVKAAAPIDADRIVLSEIFEGAFARAAYPGLLALVRRWRPDVVLRETCEFASERVARVTGVPTMAVECFLSGSEFVTLPVGERYLTLSPPSFDPRPGAVRFRAPAERVQPLPDWWGGNRSPLVYVSFGSAAAGNGFFPDLYRAAAEELGALDVRVLMTLGTEVDPARLGPVPANVHVERWVPQAAVMPAAAAMVGHGGSGSTLQAMAAGLPLAVVPLFADQPQNAARVAFLGAGLALNGVDGLGPAVRHLLDDPNYWIRAQRVGLEIAALEPIDAVAPLLREFARGEALAA